MKKMKTMTEGVIWKEILFFAIPLILGNLFQQLYNTVDSIIVGNYVGSNALAAVGYSGAIINLLIGFCIGASTGAGVVISQFYGAKNTEGVRKAVHTTMAIALVAGVLLGFVYDITKDPIAAQNEKAKQEAYKEVMADADSFEALSGDAYSEANITATFAAALQADAENYTADEITEVVAGVKDGKVIGLVVTVVAGDGYGGDIKFSVGVGADGTYLGTSILSISETAGLGMRVKTSPDFLAQFKSANTDKFVLVKDGSGAAAGDEKIDAISGSTVTSKAVLRGVNSALIAYKEIYAAKAVTVGGVSVE